MTLITNIFTIHRYHDLQTTIITYVFVQALLILKPIAQVLTLNCACHLSLLKLQSCV